MIEEDDKYGEERIEKERQCSKQERDKVPCTCVRRREKAKAG